jgi:preprotein translocase subunit SecB
MSKTGFSFKDFKINSINFDINKSDVKSRDIDIKFEPKGEVYLGSNLYVLNLDFYSKNANNDHNFFECSLSAEFEFESTIEEENDIPDFFFVNSIAIIFPYLRAFISNVTMLANQKSLILPTMNLVGLKDQLKENTSYVERK